MSTPAAPAPAAPAVPDSGTSLSDRAASAASAAQDKPEVAIAGAFVGGILLARILKRIGGG